MLKRTIAGLVGAGVISAAHGSTEPIYIHCTIEKTYNFSTGLTTPTTGSKNFIILAQPDGSTTYTLPFSCVNNTLRTKISETIYFFGCEQKIGDFVASIFAEIDRVSGEYQEGFSPVGQDGLVHMGFCERSDRRF